jgi:hypothetical protein
MTNSILTKTTIALATVLTLGSASVAVANDIDESGSSAQAAREWNQYVNHKAPQHLSNGAAAYGFAPGFVQGHEQRNDRVNDRVDDNR